MNTYFLTDTHALDGARRRLMDGKALPAGLLPEPVARSWERSRDAGLDPWEHRLLNADAQIFTLDEVDRNLASCVKPEIQPLWQVFGGQFWTLFCVNAKGVIIHAQHAVEDTPLNALQVGRRIHEADIGTTAPSRTLAEKQPIILHGKHHYLSEFDRFFCASVPVNGVDGQMIGAIDITGIGERNARGVLDQLRITAMAIENRLYANLKNCRILSLQHDPRLIGTPLQGLLAMDGEGRILAANGTARRLLRLDNASNRGYGQHWDALFEQDPTAKAQSGSPSLAKLNDGSQIFAHVLSVKVAKPGKQLSMRPVVRSPLGDDSALNQQFDIAHKAFNAGIPVLIQGETGTGKEMFARALHEAWQADAPFVAINCSAIPESLIEAELFGYADGTFTGGRKGGAKGRIEEANGGTLLLDEIGDMPTALQTRLLRVLQERQVTRLGSSESRSLDLRIVSATHCNLTQLIRERHFREDLYYRLNGVQIHLPALHERRDLSYLIQTLLLRYGSCYLSPESLTLILAQRWPGNIRQLEQTLRLACALAGEGEEILPEHLPACMPSDTSPISSLKAAEQKTIQEALRANRGNVSATALALGISRTTLHNKLKSAARP
ncbi:MAG TPA: Fis family transcriptional regulator [Pseudomonas sp.]|nr:Fis family transcriptional regulator [Pseudomonas sp.]